MAFYPPGAPAGGAATDQTARDAAAAAQATANAAMPDTDAAWVARAATPAGTAGLSSPVDSHTKDWTNGATGAVTTRTRRQKHADVLDIRDFGAKLDAVVGVSSVTGTDDTAAWNAALAWVAQTPARRVTCPSGFSRITSTLATPVPGVSGALASTGGKIVGTGVVGRDPLLTTARMCSTTLLWDGANGGTMLTLDQHRGISLENIALSGQAYTGAASRAGVLILVKNGTGVAGSGSHIFRDMSFFHSAVGAQFGELTADVNCDTTDFSGKTRFIDVGKGLYVINSQGLGFTFNTVHASGCKSVFYFAGGGYLDVNMLDCPNCGGVVAAGAEDYVLYVEAGGGGNNAYTYTLRNVRPEQGTYQIVKAIGKCSVIMDNYHEGQSITDKRLFWLGGGRLIMRGGLILTNGATTPPFVLDTHGTSEYGQVEFQSVAFGVAGFWDPRKWIDTATGNLIPKYRLRSCVDYSHKSIVDFGSRIEHGLVMLWGQTGNATPQRLTLDGGTSGGFQHQMQMPTGVAEVEFTIIGRTTTDTVYCRFIRRVLFHRVAGNSTVVVDSSVTPATDVVTSTEGVAITGNASGADVTVTGVAATTIKWMCMARLVGGHVDPT